MFISNIIPASKSPAATKRAISLIPRLQRHLGTAVCEFHLGDIVHLLQSLHSGKMFALRIFNDI